jgi:hypothetical protein
MTPTANHLSRLSDLATCSPDAWVSPVPLLSRRVGFSLLPPRPGGVD